LQLHNLQTLYFISLSSVFDFVAVFVAVGAKFVAATLSYDQRQLFLPSGDN
jgi:hypothetical protein